MKKIREDVVLQSGRNGLILGFSDPTAAHRFFYMANNDGRKAPTTVCSVFWKTELGTCGIFGYFFL